MMEKFDLKKIYKQLYSASTKSAKIVYAPLMNFLTTEGQGNPDNSSSFKRAAEILIAVSFAIKFNIKNLDPSKDYTVMPLEGVWWSNGTGDFSAVNRDEWHWKLMIMQPDFISRDNFIQAKEEYEKKKGISLDCLKFEMVYEGLSAQIMHVGPYSEERPSIEKMYKFIKDNDYHFNGKHREVYLGDPRKSKPHKLKTILRQPVMKIEAIE